MKTKVIIGLVIAALIGAGAFFVLKNNSDDSNAEVTPTTESTQTTQADTKEETTKADTTVSDTDDAVTTITYSNGGFTPSSITVKSGGKVTVKNDSSRTLDFESGPHPAHTSNSELNAGTISAGKSETFTVTDKGTFSIHNHVLASHEATVIVE